MQTRQGSHTESKPHILNSKKMYTDRLLPSPQHSNATLLFCEPDASPSWTAESMIISVQDKDGIDQQRGWISQLSPTPQHEADHSWDLKLYSSPTGGKSLAELYLRVLVSCLCLQWALNVAQNEAAQPRQSQGGIQGEPRLFWKNTCSVLPCLPWGCERDHLRHSHCLRCPLSSLLQLPVSLHFAETLDIVVVHADAFSLFC